MTLQFISEEGTIRGDQLASSCFKGDPHTSLDWLSLEEETEARTGACQPDRWCVGCFGDGKREVSAGWQRTGGRDWREVWHKQKELNLQYIWKRRRLRDSDWSRGQMGGLPWKGSFWNATCSLVRRHSQRGEGQFPSTVICAVSQGKDSEGLWWVPPQGLQDPPSCPTETGPSHSSLEGASQKSQKWEHSEEA